MAAGGDPEAIRAHARRLRTTAEEVTATRHRIAAGAGIDWTGVAAGRYRERLVDHIRRVGAAQDEMRRTADALDRLADELEARQAAIKRAMALVEDRLADARRTVDRLGGLAEDVLDGAQRAARDSAQAVLGAVRGGLPSPGLPAWSEIADRIGRIG
jgi:uncharacterized protein YukE